MTNTGIFLFALGQIISVPFYVLAIKRIKDFCIVDGVVAEIVPLKTDDGYQLTIKASGNIEFKTTTAHNVTLGVGYKLAVCSNGNVSIFDGYIWEFGIPMVIFAGTLPLLML